MSAATCPGCGMTFYRDQPWKTRCYSCWAESKRPQPTVQVIYQPDPIRAELRDRLRALLMLAHPDKHAGSPLANSTTAWLLKVREQISTKETA